ncbi:MAG: hypothetical protein ACP5OA_04585 [Candidatus Woesearchaeota archaeon]
MNKYLKIGLIIFAIIIFLIICMILFLGWRIMGWFDTTCITHNCKTHSCNITTDCSDVYCDYKGPILGGGGPTQCYNSMCTCLYR